jgi:hypothetical protein
VLFRSLVPVKCSTRSTYSWFYIFILLSDSIGPIPRAFMNEGPLALLRGLDLSRPKIKVF